MLAPLKIVYNIVFNIIIASKFAAGCRLRRADAAPTGQYGRKTAQAGDSSSAKAVRQPAAPAREPAAASSSPGASRRTSCWAASAARAPDRAGSLRPVPDPSRRCAAGAVRTREKGPGRAHSQSRRDGARTDAARGEGNLRGSRRAGSDGGAHHSVSGRRRRKSTGWRNCSGSTPPPIAKGDLLTVFYSNLRFHQVLFGLCGNACLIETIDLLAQKVYGIRSYAQCVSAIARPRAPRSSRHDQGAARLAPGRADRADPASSEAVAASLYQGLRTRFGKAEIWPHRAVRTEILLYSALLTSLMRGSAASVRLR